MRSLSLLVVLTACAGAPAPSTALRPAVGAEPIASPPAASARDCAAVDPMDPRTGQRAAVRGQLDTIDRELDAIDDELAASAVPGPQTLADAVAQAIERSARLEHLTVDTMSDPSTPQLRRLAHLYVEARRDDLEVEAIYGPRNPERIVSERRLDAVRTTFERQRAVELAELAAVHAELAKLTASAGAAKIRQAALRALAATLGKTGNEGYVPSDAPADVRVAADRLAATTRLLALATTELGPKHPQIVLLHAQLEEATTNLAASLRAADRELAAEIAMLDGPRAQLKLDPSRLAHRAELAARARDLRREYDALH